MVTSITSTERIFFSFLADAGRIEAESPTAHGFGRISGQKSVLQSRGLFVEHQGQ